MKFFLRNGSADSLAINVYNYIQQINKSANVSVDEIQFDCDWSLKSKQNYFQFIEEFKNYIPIYQLPFVCIKLNIPKKQEFQMWIKAY